MNSEEYGKLLNRELLLNNERLKDDNIMGIDCVLAPQDPKERRKLEILFAILRKERNSLCPYLSKFYVHFDSSRGIDW